MFAVPPDLDDVEDFDRFEWPEFSKVVSEIWKRLERMSPVTKRGVLRALPREPKSIKGLDLEPNEQPLRPPWVEERIVQYGQRLRAGLMIFEDRTIADAEAEDVACGRLPRRLNTNVSP